MRTAISGTPDGGVPQPGEIYLVEISGSVQRQRDDDPLAGVRRNHRITVPQVHVFSPEGKLLGILDTKKAINLALEMKLDLVEVESRATPPVCRIMDFGKYADHHLRELIEDPRRFSWHETVTKSAQGEGKFVTQYEVSTISEGTFIRQPSCESRYGHLVVKLEPNGKGRGVEVIDEIVDGTIPKRFIEAAIAYIKGGCDNGVIGGNRVVDIIVRLIDGSFHEVDSSELAFKMAGIFALRDAMMKADPVLIDLRTDAPITGEARSEKVRPAVVVQVGVEGRALHPAVLALLAARGFHSTFRGRRVLCVPLTTKNHGSMHEVPLGKLPFLDEEIWAYIPGAAPIGTEKLVRLLGSVSSAQLEEIKAALG